MACALFAIGSRRLMQLGCIFQFAIAQRSPKLHAAFAWQGNKVVCEILDLFVFECRLENLFCFHFLNQSTVVVDIKLVCFLNLAIINDILDCDLSFLILNEVGESNGSFKAYESTRKIEKNG